MNRSRALGLKLVSFLVPACARLNILTELVKLLVRHVAEDPLRKRNQAGSHRRLALAEEGGGMTVVVGLDGALLHCHGSFLWRASLGFIGLLLGLLGLLSILHGLLGRLLGRISFFLVGAIKVLGILVVEKGEGRVVSLAVA